VQATIVKVFPTFKT